MTPVIQIVQSFDPPRSERFDCRVFVDVLRASTTLTVLASRGARRVVCANERRVCDAYLEQGYVMFSEVFDGGYGNSPTQASSVPLAGRDVVHKSANFSNALFQHAGEGPMLVGAFVNLQAVAAAARQHERVLIVAAGSFGARTSSVEDDACAAMLRMLIEDPQVDLAAAFAEAIEAVRRDIEQTPRRPDGGPGSQFRDDVAYAMRLGVCPVVPTVIKLDGTCFELGVSAT